MTCGESALIILIKGGEFATILVPHTSIIVSDAPQFKSQDIGGEHSLSKQEWKNEKLSNAIREQAKANGMSLAELSLRSGVSYDMLKRYGRQYMPSAEALVSIARELGTTAEELLK